MIGCVGRSTATLSLLAAVAVVWSASPAPAQTRSTAKVSTVVQEGHPLHQGLVFGHVRHFSSVLVELTPHYWCSTPQTRAHHQAA